MIRRTHSHAAARSPIRPLATKLACALLVTLGGCRQDSAPLARVGSGVITREDFETAARNNGRQYATMGDSARPVLLDDLVRRQLMIEAAKRIGLYRDTTFLDFAAVAHDQAAREELFKALSGDGIPVSEAETHAFYLRRGTEALTKVIFVGTEATARAALDELHGGADFMLIAAKYNQRGMVPNGGDLGWIAPGSLMPALDHLLLDAPLGEVAGPVHSSGQGWFLLRVDERRPAALPEYARVREQISSALAQRKQRAYLLGQVDRLKQAWDLRVVPGAAAGLVTHVRTAGGDKPDPLGRAPVLPPLALVDQARVLATWRGGEYTLGEAWGDLRKANAQVPNFSMQPMVEGWIEGQAIDRMLIAEAAVRRLTDDPDGARSLRERQNNYLLEAYYALAVMQSIHVGEDEVRAEFARRSSEFTTLTDVRVSSLRVADSTVANQLVMHMGHAATMADAAAMAGMGSALKTEDLHFPNRDPMWQTLMVRFQRMRNGEYGGPFSTPQGWLLLQLHSKTQRAASWEELPDGTKQQLQSDVIARLREMRFVQLTDSLRQAIPVTIDREALSRAAWPTGSMPPPGFSPGG